MSFLTKKRCLSFVLPYIHEGRKDICEACVASEQHKATFIDDIAWRAITVLEFVHYDICEPMQRPTTSGVRYVIFFVDNISGKTRVYIVKKIDALSKFRVFKATIKKHV